MPRKYRVDIARKAEQDLREIWEHIAEQNPRTAELFAEALHEHAKSLEQFPERCPLIRENPFLDKSYRHCIYKKYRIIFCIEGNTVYVTRVIHGARLLVPAYFLQ